MVKQFTKEDIEDLFADMFGLKVNTSKPESITPEDKSNLNRFEKGDIVTYDTEKGVGYTGKFFGAIDNNFLVQVEDGSIHIAKNLKKVQKAISKQDAKNKICNILETQLNPKIIQKIIDIVNLIEEKQ